MSENEEQITAGNESSSVSAEVLRSDEYSEYLLHSKSEIIYLLRALKDQGDRVTIFFNEGKDFFLTEIIGVADNAVLLDVGSNRLINQRAQEAERLFCVTRHEKVRIQFLLRGLTQTTHEGHPAFQAALPETVLRLQRREFFRLTTPIARPLKCMIPVLQADGKFKKIETTVIDISGGGLAITSPDGALTPEVGDEYANCHIDLPEIGSIVSNVQVRSVFEVLLKNGTRIKRAGCKFIELPGPMMTLVQRYILKMERERKARESGLA